MDRLVCDWMNLPWPIKLNTFRCCHVSIHSVGHSEEAGSWLIWLLLEFPYWNTEKKSSWFKSSSMCEIIKKTLLKVWFGWHTNKVPESELHLGLVRRTSTRELCFNFQVFKLQVQHFLLQGLLEPRAPLLIWTQVRDGESNCEAQHWSTDSQWYVTVGRSVAVIKENFCKGLVLCRDTIMLLYTMLKSR